jgi:Phosphotransferase enzyme family
MCHGLDAMVDADVPWRDLFGTHEGQGLIVEMRLLRKRGRPFLAWPGDPRMALPVLGLYPAQTLKARLAKKMLTWLVRARVPAVTEGLSLTVYRTDPFVEFLLSLSGPPAASGLGFGLLAGNPASSGQRFVVLLFDPGFQPIAVVKAGLTEAARDLIQREESFLAAVGGRRPGIPRLRGVFSSPRVRALALDFARGQAPRPWNAKALPAVLWRWVDAAREVLLSELPDWRRLHQAAAASAPWPAVGGSLGHRKVHPVIGHGDFAPWNIKVSPQGIWTALDWERGEELAIPGWDWLHYIIQPAILVEHLRIPELVARIEALLVSTAFKRYAGYTGIAGIERELALAYLLHSIRVIQPSEGLAETRELGAILAERWG